MRNGVGRSGMVRDLRRFWTDLSLRTKGFVVVAIPLVPLVLTGLAYSHSARIEDETQSAVTRALVVKSELLSVLMVMVEAENEVGRFLSTRNRGWLDEYRVTVQKLPGAMTRLSQLLVDPAQRLSLQRLVTMARQRPLSALIEAAGDNHAIVPAALLAQSTERMKGLRNELERMQQREDELLAERTAKAHDAQERTSSIMVAGVVLGLGGGVVAMLLFITGVLSRVQRLQQNTRHLAQGLPLLPWSGGADEVGELSRDLEATARLLSGRERAVQDHAARLQTSADEVRELNAALEAQMRDLAAVNKELEAFTYSVSHDLRAPLRHIGGFAALLERSAGSALGDQGRRHLATIAESAQRMGRLIDDLLSFSRMGRADLATHTVDLGALVADAWREVSGNAGDRQIIWRQQPLPPVWGDAAMLRIALVNLLANAVKYTAGPRTAEIEVSATQVGDEVVVAVRDNGVGFDMKYIDKLFGVFQRLHSAEEFEGTGIGLANVRRIVHRHRGSTWAESIVDHGSTFYVSLPAAPVSLAFVDTSAAIA